MRRRRGNYSCTVATKPVALLYMYRSCLRVWILQANAEGGSIKNNSLERSCFLNSANMGSPALINGDMERVACIHNQQVLPELTYNPLACGGAPPEHPQSFLLESSMVPAAGPQTHFLPMPPPCYYHPPSEHSYFNQSSHHLQTAMMPPMQSLGTAEEGTLLHQLGGTAKVTSTQNHITIHIHACNNVYNTVYHLFLIKDMNIFYSHAVCLLFT